MVEQFQNLDGLLPAVMRFDIESYVGEYNGTRVSRNEWVLLCPSCGKEKLMVNTDKRTWHCWVCEQFESVVTAGGVRRRVVSGAGGLVDLIQVLEEVDRVTAARKIINAGLLTASELTKLSKDMLGERSPVGEVGESIEIVYPESWVPFFDTGNSCLGAAWMQAQSFLAARGITKEDVRHFRLGWCWSGRYANRALFPVFEQGRLVYYQARAMWNPRPGERYVKALNPPKVDGGSVSSELLFNLDSARQFPRVVLTEGPIDCIHAGPDAVCTFGKRLSPVQVGKLLHAGVRALDFMWDADAFGEAVQTANHLSMLFDVRIVRLPQGDPGDYSRDQLRAFRAYGQQLPGLQVVL